MTFEDVAGVMHYDRASLPPGQEPSAIVATASYDSPSEVPDADGRGSFAANYTCSSTIAVVDVDPETGQVTIVDWTSAEDVGRALNPDIVTTQIQGGLAQGIGFALGEELVLDERGGVLNGSMTEYQVPTCPGIPLIEDKLFHVESRDPTHPLGQKGIGESGINAAGGRDRVRGLRRDRRADHLAADHAGEGPARASCARSTSGQDLGRDGPCRDRRRPGRDGRRGRSPGAGACQPPARRRPRAVHR